MGVEYYNLRCPKCRHTTHTQRMRCVYCGYDFWPEARPDLHDLYQKALAEHENQGQNPARP
jgi:hypothetical protein